PPTSCPRSWTACAPTPPSARCARSCARSSASTRRRWWCRAALRQRRAGESGPSPPPPRQTSYLTAVVYSSQRQVTPAGAIMARAAAPAEIRAGVLHVNGAPLCAVGTPEWRAWLADPESRAFRFQGARGALSARRERQRNGWYWYAYRRAGGRLRKAYLGRDE